MAITCTILHTLFAFCLAAQSCHNSDSFDNSGQCDEEMATMHDHILLLQVQREFTSSIDDTSNYSWPSGMGHLEHYCYSNNEAPRDFSKGPAWNWTDPRGRYLGSPSGVNIDGKNNIYLVAQDGIHKFTSKGELLWSFLPPERNIQETEVIADAASLYKGAIYFSTTAGRLYAISMETGKQIWMSKPCPTGAGNNGFVNVDQDTVIFGSCAGPGGIPGFNFANRFALGVNATNGNLLWTFKPDIPVWNFVASFAGDGTFIFQDYNGKVYRNRVSDGTNIWKNGGGFIPTWTDGVAMLGPNKLVYAVNNILLSGGRDNHGHLTAYHLEDGRVKWQAVVPRPPNGMPAVGRLKGHLGLSVALAIGQQCQQGNPTDIYTFDAENGELRWIFNGPSQTGVNQAGNSMIAMQQRDSYGLWGNSMPNPWSAPTIDASGTLFIGNQEGGFYALADVDGDGVVQGDGEVSMYDTGACFALGAAPAIAPGMIVAASIDAMYVFENDAMF